MSNMPMIWDRPEDANHTWHGGRELVTPLQQSLSLYYYQGWATAFRAVKAIGGLRARYWQGYEYRRWEYADTLAPAQADVARLDLEAHLPERWAQEWLPLLEADLAAWRAEDLAAYTDHGLAHHLHAMLTRQLTHWEIHAFMGSVPLSAVQRLIDWYLARFPSAPESEPYRLLQGQSNTSVESNRLLWQLAQRTTADIAALLQAGAWERLPAAFSQPFIAYLERAGDQTEIHRRRAAELILGYAAGHVADPAVELERLAAERASFTAAVRAKLDAVELAEFEKLLACALANHPLTEDHNLWLDQQSNRATRRVLDEFARRLVAQGILERADDIEYLIVYELIQWGFGLADPLRPRVAARQAEYAAYRQLTPPEYLGRPPQPAQWVDRFSGPALPLDGPPGELRGVGASVGVVRGPARVVTSLDEALALRPGEILVCPSTDPNWTPLFALAAGLVTDQGGSLCHAAVVAREYRLPAVVGAHTATRQIASGQIIELDGLHGIVRLA
jgi:pyruvate,water dikinase